MLLRIGLALSAVATVLAVVAVAVIVTQDEPARPSASLTGTTAQEPPLALQRSYRDRPESPPEKAPRLESPPEKAPRLESLPEKAPRPESPPEKAPSLEATPLPAGNPGWPRPKKSELERLEEPQRFTPDPNAESTLTLPTLGVFDAPIYDSDSPAALEAGIAHVPETAMPWDRGKRKNVYLAAHRLGYPGTGSRLLFYNLGQLERGDEVIVEGRGETYRYRVAEKRIVDPSDRWVMGEVRNRDMLTLQTCTPVPTFEKRLIVRADRL